MTLRALILSLLLVLPLAVRAQPVPEAVQRFGPPDAARHLLVRGTTDIPLTPNGETQARQLGGRLAGVDFACVWASPRDRRAVHV